MLKVVIGFLLVAYVAAAKLKWYELDSTYKFETYLQHYEKKYTNPQEYEMRKAIFDANLRHVIAHNQDTTKTWKEEINHLADLTDEEFSNLRGYTKSLAYARKSREVRDSSLATPSIEDLPASVDWRAQGVVTAVKDQGHCGSCWSFAAAETLESHWAIKYPGRLYDLSEQQILDCTLNPQHCGGQGGCNGGTAEVAYDTIIKVGGLQEEWTYPYTSYFGANQTCGLQANNSKLLVASLTSYTTLPSNQYAPLLNAIATVGPIAISVDASAWKLYATGVFNGCNQANPDLDHAVQLVGYGTENGQDYWLVRNSWTPAWGEGGYIKIYRTANVQCGTDLTPADGSGCDGGPAQVTVCGTCGILYDTLYPVVA
jgi:cathepsin L